MILLAKITNKLITNTPNVLHNTIPRYEVITHYKECCLLRLRFTSLTFLLHVETFHCLFRSCSKRSGYFSFRLSRAALKVLSINAASISFSFDGIAISLIKRLLVMGQCHERCHWSQTSCWIRCRNSCRRRLISLPWWHESRTMHANWLQAKHDA